jgi:hypothetical protein
LAKLFSVILSRKQQATQTQQATKTNNKSTKAKATKQAEKS